MALTVRTNVGALNAIKTLNGTQNSLTKSLGRVSSGSRINRAGDDAAGLSVSSRMKSDNVSLKASMRNTNDGISLIQTAEGSLTEVYNLLTRMRELTVQASNDTYGSKDRNQIKIEFDQLRTEISRITSDANFNRISVLKSSKTLNLIFDPLAPEAACGLSGSQNQPRENNVSYSSGAEASATTLNPPWDIPVSGVVFIL